MYDLAKIQDGQLPLLNTYNHLLVCFPISDDGSSRESTIKALQVDANKLPTNFLWLVGKVVNLPLFSISQQPHYRNKHKL